MIGKVTGGSNPIGLLNYCYYEKEKLSVAEKACLTPADVRGEIVYIQNLGIDTLHDGRFDMDYLAKQFRDCADKNQNLKNYVWHQSFSFPKGETPTKEQIQRISTTFAKDFGFSDNQLVVFQHNDTNHAHFHIVANRINFNGKTTANDGYSYLKTGTFCRKIELELGLQTTPNMKALLPEKEREIDISTNKLAQNIRDRIDRNLSKCNSMEDLRIALQKEGLKMYQKRGVSFLDTKTAAKFKGSDLGREYSLMNIEKRLGQQPEKEKAIMPEKTKDIEIKSSPKIEMDWGMGM
jgi:hypothetical protein